ncbi:MAG: adenylate kinase [Clostridia bacterium]
MRLIFLGAPGAGKGTQATRVSKNFSIPHISTGDILRKNIKEKTELGNVAKSYIDQGQLVPDDVVINIVKDRIQDVDCKNGFLLDGFPRTLEQAIALDKITKIDAVINLQVPYGIIMDRITGRRMCTCGESYHISWGIGDTCPKCGAKLYQRDDDKEETVKARIEVYDKQTTPLIKFYKAQGILKDINGNADVDVAFAQILGVLNDNN